MALEGTWAHDLGQQARLLGTDVCFHVTTHDRKKVGAQGKVESADKIVCLWVDIDVADKEGAAKSYPLINLVLSLLGGMDLQPSAIAHCGNGLHAYWFLDLAIAAQTNADLPK